MSEYFKKRSILKKSLSSSDPTASYSPKNSDPTASYSSRNSDSTQEKASKVNGSSTPPEHQLPDFSPLPRNRIGFLSAMRACSAMTQVLETQHNASPMMPEPTFLNPPDNSLNAEKLDMVESRIFDLEQKLRTVTRQVNECKRSRQILIERIRELENSIHKSNGIRVITALMNVIPTENDLRMLEKMKNFETERLEIDRRINLEERKNRVLAETMGRAEAILTATPIIKKTKHVVIIEQDPDELISKPDPVQPEHRVFFRGFPQVAPLQIDEAQIEEEQMIDIEEPIMREHPPDKAVESLDESLATGKMHVIQDEKFIPSRRRSSSTDSMTIDRPESSNPKDSKKNEKKNK